MAADTPYCTCGKQHAGGYKRLPDGRWVCGNCGSPSKTVYEKSIARATVASLAAGTAGTQPGGVNLNVLKVANSEIQTMKRCKRKWWLSYYLRLRLRREGVGALSVGNMVHFPLEIYYRGQERNPETFDWRTPLAEHYQERLAHPEFPHDKAPEMQADYELASIMLKGYFEWLTEEGMDSDIEIVSAEREVEVFLDQILGWDVHLIAKLDTEIRLKSNGWRSFMDHKSVANVKDLPKIIEMNEQLKMYGLIQRLEAHQRQTGEQQFAHGGVLNQIRKVKRTAKSNPPYYDRAGVMHNDEVYATFYRRVFGEVYDLLTLRARLDAGNDHQQVAYPTPTRDCSWDCPFLLICPRFDDGSDVGAIIAEQYEQHDPYARYVELEKG